eukprot:13158257-Alexandrium_andersonii.AAC.1
MTLRKSEALTSRRRGSHASTTTQPCRCQAKDDPKRQVPPRHEVAGRKTATASRAQKGRA